MTGVFSQKAPGRAYTWNPTLGGVLVCHRNEPGGEDRTSPLNWLVKSESHPQIEIVGAAHIVVCISEITEVTIGQRGPCIGQVLDAKPNP